MNRLKTKCVEDGRCVMDEVLTPPYTVVSHSYLLPSFHLALAVGGLRELLDGLHDDDRLHICIKDRQATEFTIQYRTPHELPERERSKKQ